MKTIVVGVGDCQLSMDPDSELVTYALGSCVAVMIWDPAALVGGMLHLMLPDSRVDQNGTPLRPYRYADTGIPLLFEEASRLGAARDRLVVRLAGGAAVSTGSDFFNIGQKNCAALKRMFRQAGIRVHAEETGGSLSRTARLHVGTGQCVVRDPLQGGRELPLKRQRAASAEIGRACSGALIELFESMLFATPKRPPAAGLRPQVSCHTGSIAFRGNRRGRFTLLLERDAALWLAARFFGREDQRTLTPTQVNYVVCELTGILCRNALLRLEPAADIDFHQPAAGFEPSVPRNAVRPDWISMELEAGAIALRLQFV